MAQHSTNSIGSYIFPRGNMYWFKKRWPKPLIDLLGNGDPFDRQTLKVKLPNMREAELRAIEVLAIHEAKVAAALRGVTSFDLTDITTIDQIPDEPRAIIDRLSQVSQIQLPQAVIAGLGDTGPHQYIDMYVALQSDDLRGKLHSELSNAGVILKTDSPLFAQIYKSYWDDKLKALASFERFRRIDEATKLPVNDLEAFERKVFEKPINGKEPHPAPPLSVFAELYKTQYTSGRGGKPLSDKNKAQIATALRWFISALDDEAINRVTSHDIIQFFDDLQGFPAGHHLMRGNTRTFREMLELEGAAYEKKLSRETSKDYWQILNKFFQKAKIKYKGAFAIENPFDDLKMDDYVRGRESKESLSR